MNLLSLSKIGVVPDKYPNFVDSRVIVAGVNTPFPAGADKDRAWANAGMPGTADVIVEQVELDCVAHVVAPENEEPLISSTFCELPMHEDSAVLRRRICWDLAA